MVSVCIYFQIHQPTRIRKYQIFDIGKNHNYFDHVKNQEILDKIVKKCYLPTNHLLLGLINKMNGKLKISLSLTGIVLEQLELHAPKVIESFKSLVDTGCIELLSETYHHSLAFIYSKKEFEKQIELHRKKIKALFGLRPKVFRNTELIYSNELSNFISKLGYKGILTEGVDRILGWRSPNFIYKSKTANIKLLLKNYRLSDDIAFRFGEKSWHEYPLTADKFANWINKINGNGNVVNLFMDYETFGEHQWADKGIFNFLRALPQELLKHPDNDFVTPSEALSRYGVVGELDIPNLISWADLERDLSAWLGNSMQQESIKQLYILEDEIMQLENPELLRDWRLLQTSDHFYYMCSKWFADGDVHKYFNPFESPYDTFISFMNILNDLKIRIKEVVEMKKINEKLRDVPGDKSFWVNDGSVIKNLPELEKALQKMKPETFNYHVNTEKNDFHNWIRDVVGDQQLAEELKGIKNKANAASVVNNRIKELRTQV
jgi:alpha-amylase